MAKSTLITAKPQMPRGIPPFLSAKAVQKQLPKILERPITAPGGCSLAKLCRALLGHGHKLACLAHAVCVPGTPVALAGLQVCSSPGKPEGGRPCSPGSGSPPGSQTRGVTLLTNNHAARDAVPMSSLRKTFQPDWRLL